MSVHMQRKRGKPAQTRPMKPPQPYSEFSKGIGCSSLVLVPYTREWSAWLNAAWDVSPGHGRWRNQTGHFGMCPVLVNVMKKSGGKVSQKLQGRAACQRDGIIKEKGWL